MNRSRRLAPEAQRALDAALVIWTVAWAWIQELDRAGRDAVAPAQRERASARRDGVPTRGRRASRR